MLAILVLALIGLAVATILGARKRARRDRGYDDPYGYGADPYGGDAEGDYYDDYADDGYYDDGYYADDAYDAGQPYADDPYAPPRRDARGYDDGNRRRD